MRIGETIYMSDRTTKRHQIHSFNFSKENKRKMRFFCFITVVLLPFAIAIPIDNGVEGDPEVECGASSITVNFNTRNNFEGHVYVKGRFAEAGCRSDEGGRKVAGINLPFTACGTERERSLNPRGVFVRQSVVVSFHPQFLTKVDRAYTIQCFYMEADKTVSQELEVSEITTQFQSQQVPMPVCRYDILDNGPTGQPIKFATIGQQVYHKWTCDTETTDIFCMVVHDCFVDDGAGNSVTILNEQGCGLDRHLLQNLEYTTDLMAGRESHVFKFADKAALFFQCQISITIKEPGAQCARPQCPEPGGPGSAISTGAGVVAPRGSVPPKPAGTAPPKPAGSVPPKPLGSAPPKQAGTGTPPPAKAAGTTPKPGTGAPNKIRGRVFLDSPFRNYRNKRSTVDVLGIVDVRAQPITTLDLDDDSFDSKNLPQPPAWNPTKNQTQLIPADPQSYCLSPVSIGLLAAFAATSTLTTIVVGILLYFRKASSK